MNKEDNLTVSERAFYENAKLKLSYSLMLAALGMMLLGKKAELKTCDIYPSIHLRPCVICGTIFMLYVYYLERF